MAQAHESSSGPGRFASVCALAVAVFMALATGCGSDSVDGGTNRRGEQSPNSPINGSGDDDGPGGSNGDGSQGPGGGEDGNPEGPDAGPPVIKCNPIKAGTSSVSINGANRSFDVQLPNDTSKMALLFLFHGWMQAPGKFASEVVWDLPAGRWRPFNPNAFPMPLMIVTPHDTKMIPPWGLDWDIATGGKDFVFFDAMMTCLSEQYNIEKKRVYSFGFSAGAVFTNLLSAKYPKLFAATISESGVWFNDKAQQTEILVPIVQWKWPDFDPADGGNVLLTEGGKDDFATVVSLHNANVKAMPFLKAGGRTVVRCSHGFGHTLAPDLTERNIYDYMWSHELGGPRLNGVPAGFPTPGKPVGSTSCTFQGP